MSVGSVIGTGVMVLTGIVAAKQSGPATSIAFIGGGIAAAIIVLCYAEFSSSIPSAGGSYSFTYVSLGEIIAYISGLCIDVYKRQLSVKRFINNKCTAANGTGNANMEAYNTDNIPAVLPDNKNLIAFLIFE